MGIGRRAHNDGIVLLVAPAERKARIAVGRGLESALPDATCTEIMEGAILPLFRRGDLRGGIDAGVAAIIAKLRHKGSG
ncbi:TPM domain-containing protein [Hephaestia sp. MAHUQ-44]|nr:TPM domain-containing protein [Hephaestia sp. MAHUQ-44]